MEYITLNNGVKMPLLGYGVYQIAKEECEACVLDAIKVGYRLIDTAQSYFNEEAVGNAIEKCGVPREELFITTKVWISNYGYDKTRESVLNSMKKLKVDYLDLVLLHQPFGDYYGAYHALEDLYKEGKLRAIGVSNFYPDRLSDISAFNEITPQVNQVETNPFNQQIESCAPFGEGRNYMSLYISSSFIYKWKYSMKVLSYVQSFLLKYYIILNSVHISLKSLVILLSKA